MKKAICGAVMCAAMATLGADAAHGSTITLAGFEDFQGNSTGSFVEGNNFLYSDNSADTWTNMSLATGSSTQASGINFTLSLGLNTFTFTKGSPSGQTNAEIALFFTGDGTSFNPTYTGSAIAPPELDAYGATNGSTTLPEVPSTSTTVVDYSSKISGATASFVTEDYSGATYYTDPTSGLTVSLTALQFNSTGGTFTVLVTPEPATLGIVALGLGALGLRRRARPKGAPAFEPVDAREARPPHRRE